MKVPKAIWQNWRHAHPPAVLRRLIGSYRKLNSGWSHRLVTDPEVAEFIETEFPNLSRVISRYANDEVCLVDIWRCLILYRYGGVYSDVDIECIRPLDDLLEEAEVTGLADAETEVLLSQDHPVHEGCDFSSCATLMNCFIIAKPGARFFASYLERLEESTTDMGNWATLTGSEALSDIVRKSGGPSSVNVAVLPWQWVSPLPDMTTPIDFAEKKNYDELIRRGDWADSLDSFVSRYRWSGTDGRPSNITKYGSILFQSDGMIVSRRLEKIASQLDDATYIAGRALAEFAELDRRLLVEPNPTPISTEFTQFTNQTLKDISYVRSSSLQQRGASIGLFHLDTRETNVVTALEEALVRELIIPRGLIYVSGGQQQLYALIKDRALEHGFELLEAGAGLLMRAPDPNSRIHIPKVIHQTWKSVAVPPEFKREWIESWQNHNGPNGWQYRFWTDEDLLEFVVQHFPDFADCYCDYDHPIKKVDAARYLILKHHGGMYVDLDFACLKPFDELLAGKHLLFGTEFDDPLQHHDSVCNALMASVPRHPFWDGIEHDLRIHARAEVLHATGPHFLGRRLRGSALYLDNSSLPEVVSRQTFYPFRWKEPARDRARELSLEELAALYPHSYAITFWTGTWL